GLRTVFYQLKHCFLTSQTDFAQHVAAHENVGVGLCRQHRLITILHALINRHNPLLSWEIVKIPHSTFSPKSPVQKQLNGASPNTPSCHYLGVDNQILVLIKKGKALRHNLT